MTKKCDSPCVRFWQLFERKLKKVYSILMEAWEGFIPYICHLVSSRCSQIQVCWNALRNMLALILWWWWRLRNLLSACPWIPMRKIWWILMLFSPKYIDTCINYIVYIYTYIYVYMCVFIDWFDLNWLIDWRSSPSVTIYPWTRTQAVKHSGSTLGYAVPELRGDKELVSMAVSKDRTMSMLSM